MHQPFPSLGRFAVPRLVPGVIALSFGLGTALAQANDTVVSDNTALSSAGANEASASNWLAASFNLGGIDGESLLATVVGANSSGNASLALYSSDASALIPDSALASFTAESSAGGTLSFSLSGLTLAGGTYWAVLSNTTGTSEWSWTEDSGGTGSGFTGAWANSDDTGTTWFSNSTLYPLQLSITVSSVPEPGSWLLGLAGLVGVAGLTGVRRSASTSHPHGAPRH